MPKVLVLYYSKTGNTRKMAEAFTEGLKQEGITVSLKNVKETNVDELLEYEGVAIGSPTYYGQMAGEIKKLLDESIKFHGKMEGKVGAAFTSSGGYGCGGETTILSILQAFLIHGMIVQGDSTDRHYGAIIKEAPNERDENMIREKGRRMGKLVNKLFPKSRV